MAGMWGKGGPDLDYYGTLTKGAKKLMAMEKNGSDTSSLDFGVHAVCASCKENIMPPKKILRCAACKSVVYCSKECSKKDWAHGAGLYFTTHKHWCPENQRHMLRLPETQAILTQFPWGRVETDGTFNDCIARGRFDVLGGSGFGFWSHRGGPVPHENMGQLEELSTNAAYAQVLKPLLAKFDHLNGKDLLKAEHLTDVEGWKLPERLIPFRDFATPSKRPLIVTESDRRVNNWESWHEWRRLSKESPAALLMSFPLSAYWMIVNCMKLSKASAGRPEKRVPLLIHAIGAEGELNYIPLFSEIALLLPYHDIKLVFFGQNVEKLVSIAKKSHPESLAGKASPSTPVFVYDAPKECGSGRVEVYLHGASANWSPSILSGSEYGGPPDGIIAFNAGLGSYREWIPVIQAVHRAAIPFAVTEYTEQSCETQRSSFPQMVQPVGLTPRALEDYPIELNPFQQPGQRGIPMYRLPNLVNGFTMVVWKN